MAIDGAKALRAGIEEVFGVEQPVQRRRNHKIRYALDELPQEQQGHSLNLMRTAWKVPTASAAQSLREGMSKMFCRFPPPAQMPGGDQHHRGSAGAARAAPQR